MIGMEIVRIALERSISAAHAVEIITELVGTHGQGKFDCPQRTYDNTFLVSDPREAYVVETAGFDWAVRTVRQADRCWSISNVSNLNELDLVVSATAAANAALVGLAVPAVAAVPASASGGVVADPGFRWTSTFGDLDAGVSGSTRQARSAALLNSLAPGVDVRAMMGTLCDHGTSTTDTAFVTDIPPWEPSNSAILCVHGRDPAARSTTAASVVADFPAVVNDMELEPRLAVFWCAMYSPCLSVYLPVFIEADLPAELAIGGEHPTTDSPWWLFHAIGQDALRQGGARENEVRAAFAPLQDSFLASAYDKAADGHGLVARGQKAAASRMLSEYVAECTGRLLEVARALRPEGAGNATL
jgi:secernin